ncbi:unnamed protein product, partial [Ectocarpus sp. 12 AP-2014]
APGFLYGEWAKKEDCWNLIKVQDFRLQLSKLNGDLIKAEEISRKPISDAETEGLEIKASLERLRSVHFKTWKKIEFWGKESKKLSQYQVDMASTIGNRLRLNRTISAIERKQGLIILDLAVDKSPEVFYDLDDFFQNDDEENKVEIDLNLDRIKKLVQWDRRHKRLKPYEFKLMYDISEGNKDLTERNKYLASLNIKKAAKY